MAYLNWQKKSRTAWDPANYAATAAEALVAVDAGDLVGPGFARVTEVFNGTGTAAVLTVGLTAGDTDLFCADGNINEEATGLYQLLGGSSSIYLESMMYLFTAADTIDVLFTKDTNSDDTEGIVDFWWYVAKVDPH